VSEALVKWLTERRGIFAIVCALCLTFLRYTEHLSDTTFGLCFAAVVSGFLTASVLGDKSSAVAP
jgi:hypothetical protein